MGDTQIQYSFLLEGHEQRHAYKQLGFRVVPVPEAREVTRHWSALGKCISAGNTMGSRIIENDGNYLTRDIARLKSSCNFSAAAADRSSNTLLLTVINPLTDHNVTADGVLLRQIHHNFALQEVCRNNFQRQQVWKVWVFRFVLLVFFHEAVWLQTKDAITLVGACWWETPVFVRGGGERNMRNTFESC